MRLKLFVGGAIALALALSVLALGYFNVGNADGNAYQPEVKLVCVAVPCGSSPAGEEWHGTYYAEETNFPPDTWVVITATYPTGQPYPEGQYSHLGARYGKYGNVEKTDAYGQLPKFEWSAGNYNGLIDPSGVYRIKFYLKYHDEVVVAHTSLKMVELKSPKG